MRFFTVFDIINYKAKTIGHTTSEVYSYFKNNGINKKQMLSIQNSGVIPSDETFLNVILKYVDMTKIELELSLGRIPDGHEQIYLSNIKKIAVLLQKTNFPQKSNVKSIKPYFATDLGTLYKGDCLELFDLVNDDTIDCIFADPPFNLQKEYDDVVNDNKSYGEYINWCTNWLDHCVRALKPNGSLFIYNIPKWHTYLSSYLNNKLNFWSWITVDMKFFFPIKNRLYPAHYSLLHYVKGDKPKTFNSQRIPLQTCRFCGGEMKDYGGYKSKMNPNGVNLSDVWTDIYPVRHNSSKTRKYNELSVKLLDRVISMSTDENDLILDPFGGSGTTYAVCELLGRKWMGFEIGDCETISERLRNKDNDKILLEKVYEEKNYLFPNKVKKIRKTNGFWTDDDFQ